jgi:two-component system sensor histidine kinase KdpD
MSITLPRRDAVGVSNGEMTSPRREPSRAEEYAWAVGTILLTSAVGLALRSRLLIIDVAMLYLLAVVFVAARSHLGPAVLASVLSTALLDFLFVPPYYRFRVEDVHYFLTFAVMLAVSLTMTRLTERLRAQALAARASERRTAAVAALDRELREAASRRDLIAIATQHLRRVVGGEAAIALAEETLAQRAAPEWPTEGVFESVEVRVAAGSAYERGEPAGSGTHVAAGAEALVVPLGTAPHRLGVVAVRPTPAERPVDADERRVVEALAAHLALELEWTARPHPPAR